MDSKNSLWFTCACMPAKSLQSFLTLCDAIDCKPVRLLRPWDSPDKNTGGGCHFLLQGIFLIQGSNPPPHLLHWQVGSLPLMPPGFIKKKTEVAKSRVGLFATPCTVAHQAPLFMEFFKQEYWSGFPFSSPGDLPNPGIKSGSPALQADALPFEPPGKPPGLMVHH